VKLNESNKEEKYVFVHVTKVYMFEGNTLEAST
jgi:hypothetical protein